MLSLRSLVSFFVAVLLFAAPAAATWSIVIVDLVTGEVAVGIATCLTGFDLRPNTVVVIPGVGVAAAQSFVGPLSLRELIRNGMLAGTPVSQILQQLAAADPGHPSRQYGLASLTGGTATFTGSGAGAWAGGLTGQVGNLIYAIQGNVLTGQPVVTAAEQALQTTAGTLGDKLMAAMQAARLMGGDGRCSCAGPLPTSCGAPPPSFTKSAHIGLMIWSRPSDVDAPCSGTLGCGAGNYWMDLNVANQPATATDPVIQLQALYNAWKLIQVGRPDHYQSTVTMSAPVLRADGSSSITGTAWLRDAQGTLITTPYPVTASLAPTSTVSGITFSLPQLQPNGSYTFTMTGGFDAGTAIVDVAASDVSGRVGIWPQPVVTVTDVFGPCGAGAVPDGAGGNQAVLRVSGTPGNDRVTAVGIGQPFPIELQAQNGAPALPAGLFALWAHIGVPPAGPQLPFGSNGGSLCFVPAPFAPTPSLLLADSIGLGGIPASPAPWTLPVAGVPLFLDVALQGAMLVAPTLEVAATNAVLLRVVPLPAPIITSITPPAPTPGQLVNVVGSNFLTGLTATLSGASLPLNVVSPTALSFVTPPTIQCNAPLVLSNLGSSSVQRLVNATPFVNNSTPSGPSAGGTLVFLAGQNLLSCTVTIGGAPLIVTQQLAGAILGTLPPGTPGPTTILITNVNGCQTTRNFTYL
jgi:uncharacterized Ntn-hydrolase superfamily protein